MKARSFLFIGIILLVAAEPGYKLSLPKLGTAISLPFIPSPALPALPLPEMRRPELFDFAALPLVYPTGDSCAPSLSSPFGVRNHPIHKNWILHNGHDYAVSEGTPVIATADGVVYQAVNNAGHDSSGYGNMVEIHHDSIYQDLRFTTRYGHLSKVLVKPGQRVKRGEVIALSGNTGGSTAPHLHYEILANDLQIDPYLLIDGMAEQWAINAFPEIRQSLAAKMRKLPNLKAKKRR